jgi:beta-barrel assembly-enhancing protease
MIQSTRMARLLAMRSTLPLGTLVSVRETLASSSQRSALPTISGLAGQIAGAVVGNGVFLQYGRDQERDAESTGLPYAVGAGDTPQGLVSFFEKLKADEGSPHLIFLQSHPLPSERTEDAKTLTRAMRGAPTKTSATEYRAFKANL